MKHRKTFPVFACYVEGLHPCGHQHADELAAFNCADNLRRQHRKTVVVRVFNSDGSYKHYDTLRYEEGCLDASA